MTSSNGVTWAIPTSAPNSFMSSVTWGGPVNGELFVAVANFGSGNNVLTSPDGEVWTAQSISNNWRSVVWGGTTNNKKFVAVSITGSGNRVITSADGLTWTSRTSAADNYWQLVTWGGPSGGEKFVAVAMADNNLGGLDTDRVMTSSDDGETWNSLIPPGEARSWTSVTWGGPTGSEKFVAVSDDGSVMTSSGGTTWIMRTSAANSSWRSVTWGGSAGFEKFVAVAQYGTNLVMTSPDGVTWSLQTAASSNEWYSVTWGGPSGDEKFVAVSSSGTNDRVMTSSTVNY